MVIISYLAIAPIRARRCATQALTADHVYVQSKVLPLRDKLRYNDTTGAIYTINSKQLDLAVAWSDNLQCKEREQRLRRVETQPSPRIRYWCLNDGYIYLIIRPGAFCVPNSVALASPTLWGVQWAIH